MPVVAVTVSETVLPSCICLALDAATGRKPHWEMQDPEDSPLGIRSDPVLHLRALQP